MPAEVAADPATPPPASPTAPAGWFSWRGLGVVLLLSALLGAGAAWLERDTLGSFVVELRLASQQAGRVQIYYNRGTGLSEADSASAQVPPGNVTHTYRLALPSGRYTEFRFDPLDHDGVVTLAEPPRIVAGSGRVVRTLAYGELRPVAQIAALRPGGTRLEIALEPGAVDPKFVIPLSPPLELRVEWRDYAVPAARSSAWALGGLILLWAGLNRARWGSTATGWRGLMQAAAHPPLWLLLPVCAVVLFLREPGRFTNPQFWGEDSVIFYYDALLRGGLGELFRPYAGYLHLVPRSAAAIATFLQPRWAPVVYAAIALTGILYVAARTQSRRCPLPRHAGCALAVVLIPDAYEVLVNVDNLQWFLAGGLALLLLSADARTTAQRVHDAIAPVILGLTGPFSILFAGLFVWRAWVRRTWASTVLATLVVGCAGLQAWTIWRHPIAMAGDTVSVPHLLAAPGMRLTGSLFVGAALPQDFPLPVEMALGVVALAGLAALALHRGPLRLERAWLALGALFLLVVSLQRCRHVLPSLCHFTFGSRYFYPMMLMIVWALFATTLHPRRALARLAGGVLLWGLAVNLPRLREAPFADLHWPDYAEKIAAGEAVDIPVNPEPWVMKLPARAR